MDSAKISELFKTRRAELRLSVETVAERTKIKRAYIEALEAGDLASFGSPVYAKNFARTYARFLKIPEPEILALLPPDISVERPDSGESSAAPAISRGDAARREFLSRIFLAAAGFVVVGAFLYFFKSRPVHEEEITAVSASVDQPPDTSSAGFSADTSAAPEVARAAEPVHAADLRGISESWILWETENSRFNKLMGAGEKQSVQFSKYIRVRVGNPSGLKLMIDGNDIDMDRGSGRVYDKIFRVQDDGKLALESPR